MARRDTIIGFAGTTFLSLLLCSGGCGREIPAVLPSGCTPQARLDARIYGAIEAQLAWDSDGMECDGMPRPEDAGARLRFAGSARLGDTARQLAFIVALPDLEPGTTPSELPATVTLVEENAGRFFSTRKTGVCWVDIEFQEPLSDANRPEQFAIGGLLYCVSPLAELNGGDSVTLGDMRFAGRVDWRRPK